MAREQFVAPSVECIQLTVQCLVTCYLKYIYSEWTLSVSGATQLEV